ncbi:MAG: cysteine dioxygenase family protein [Cyclobacteriaceae bacterium]
MITRNNAIWHTNGNNYHLTQESTAKLPNTKVSLEESLLTPSYSEALRNQELPDYRMLCYQLLTDLLQYEHHSVMDFLSAMSRVRPLDTLTRKQLTNHPDSSHVLVDNEYMKIILIHWEPGALSSIHGHPDGGCVFKVLSGVVEEKKYTASDMPKLISKSTIHEGGMGFIHNDMGLHAVGNPFSQSAICLHAYAK